ncbi:hypothetical protein KL911_002277 [Ogataea haglerorum]|uniref:uncharacterized protein n=1 Tax=Ogataea haglerorum TaxID=1937702 RepID=UPI001C89D5B4|nr:uncharacterized protein KL911_002277 [Ogataea haglerorum]KAG7754838.1 hypothetical protein KL911_002277 [Ogataea haglerorum]
MTTPRIRPLEEAVVNRIAAGEIVLAPYSALKELLENSIDAQATSIDVACKEGGLKLLQITDNGVGIAKDDLALVCERFTTSKLRRFEDLQHIATYGFRGEALASISHIAHVSLVTKTRDSPCAWQCRYDAGRLDARTPEPQPVAGTDGTTLVVEDLFYNFPSRLHSLRPPAEEYAKIVDIVSKYAIHATHVGFTCKKYGAAANDIALRSGMSQKERVRAIYGSAVASELLGLEVEPHAEYGLLKCTGLITNVNFDNKKSTPPIFFINGRLVSCDPLRRAITQTYSTYLPKGHKPFVYLSLELDSVNVDVNVHPTKREVRFLFEDEIVDHVAQKIADVLANTDVSRTFLTQQLLPSPKRSATADVAFSTPKKMRPLPSLSQYKRPSEHKLVRTDFSQPTLTAYARQKASADSAQSRTEPAKVKLKSIFELKEEVEQAADDRLAEVLSKMTFIGVVDSLKRLMCFQHDIKLYIADYGALCYELFYQVGLANFSNFGCLRLSQPVSIADLLLENGLADQMDEVIQVFVEMKDMLKEYFSIEIDGDAQDPKIATLPLLVQGYEPDLSKLALFLYRSGTKLDWEDEKKCLGGLLQQLALLYVPAASENDGKIAELLETTICPLLQKRLIPNAGLARDVVEIANLPGLYRVFERC